MKDTKKKNIRTSGFITRKLARLVSDREFLEHRLKSMDADILHLLKEATRLASRKGRFVGNLNRVNRDIDKLMPRLRGEEVVVAKVMSLPGTTFSTEDIGKML